MNRCYHMNFFFQFIPFSLVNGDEMVRACDRHSNETVTLRKHVTKYNKQMRKWMVELHSKSESRGIDIARVNSIGITKSINIL